MFCGNLGKLICIVYSIYYIIDYKNSSNGRVNDRYNCPFKKLWWKHLRNYFPMKIIKTCELLLDTNYIIAAFPHGTFSASSYGNLTINSSEFRELFPGLKPILCTMAYHFNFPFYRDLLLQLGLKSVSKESILNILAKNNCYRGVEANAAVIIPGGLSEAQMTIPGQNRVNLKDRKGFIKVALETGSPLIPVYTFGENDIFDLLDTKKHPIWGYFRKLIKKYFGNKIYIAENFMPKRIPLITVVGAPIKVKQIEKPSQKDVDNIHKKFCDELKNLFDNYKNEFYGNEKHKFELIIE